MGARAIPEGKPTLWGSAYVNVWKSFYTGLSPLPAATTETLLSY